MHTRSRPALVAPRNLEQEDGNNTPPAPSLPPAQITARGITRTRSGGTSPRASSASFSYLYFIPGCFTLDSLDDGAFCTESCPRLRATMATARNLLRVPRLGLLAFCRFSRSSALRLFMLCSEHTKETCMVPCGSGWKAPSLPGAQPLLPGALRSVRGEDNGEGFPQERAGPGGEGKAQQPADAACSLSARSSAGACLSEA